MQKTGHKKTARRARTAAGRRKIAKVPGRTRIGRQAPDASRVIGNSLYDLTLQMRLGFEINGGSKFKGDFQKLYYDLLEITIVSMKRYAGITTYVDPYKSAGLSIASSLRYVFGLIDTHLLPEGYSLDIHSADDGKGESYFIVISKELSIDTMWYCFELKPAVEKLFNNKPLHDFFILFIANFLRKTQIDPWWAGGLSYADIDEMLFRLEEEKEYDMEEDEYLKALSEIHEAKNMYQEGFAKKYQDLIKKQKTVSIEQLREMLGKFNKRMSPLVEWMYSALEVMELPCGVMNFCYRSDSDGYYSEGLEFDLQISFIWDVKDILTHEQEQYLDAEANGVGILPPTLHMVLKKEKERYPINIKSISELPLLEIWPQEITTLFHHYNDAIS